MEKVLIPQYIVSFIRRYPMFRIKPSLGKIFIIEGDYERILSNKRDGDIQIKYSLSIHISEDYPASLPVVFEQSNKIEKTPENHVNHDGSLCLGTPIRLKIAMNKGTSLISFFEKCILSYLYAVTLKITRGEAFVFGELAHGNIGLIDDFKSLFNMSEEKHVLQMLFLLSINKKTANRSICPYGCEKRLSACKHFDKVQQMRKLLSRSEWEEQRQLITGGY